MIFRRSAAPWSARSPRGAETALATSQNPARERRTVGNVAYMLLAAGRDVQWRKRRFVIAILSTAIIFGITLVLTGLANGFRAEAQ